MTENRGSNDGLKRYLEAGAVLGHVTRARAEEIVRELVSAGDVQREQAQRWVDELVERSRRASEELLELVRSEVTNQLGAMGLDPEELARQAADLLRHSAEVGRAATSAAADRLSGSPRGGGRKASGSRAAAKKSAGTAKKRTAKKSAGAAKRTAKKSAGVAKKRATATKKAATKSSAARKATKATKATKKATKSSASRSRAAKKSGGSSSPSGSGSGSGS